MSRQSRGVRLTSLPLPHAQFRSQTPPPHRVLVVDDSRVQRRILASQLARAGHIVTEAASAEDALTAIAGGAPDIVISDWMMTGMTGPEFCRSLRALPLDGYVYFILLTSKNQTFEIAGGLEAGANDFLTKPVTGDELRARISAGQRILRMERELKEKNRLLTATLAELQGLYDSLDRDLVEASRLQQSLVRERHRSFGTAAAHLLLRPAGHVGGDLVGFFQINARHLGLFAIDVSGHGVASALMTARLAGFLSADRPDQNIALCPQPAGGYLPRAPAEVAADLNRLAFSELRSESYFTMAYAHADLVTGSVALVQAGHPNPAILRADGSFAVLGRGGFPIGLFEDASYETVEARLHPGERLLLMSDGLTEAPDGLGGQMGPEGVARIASGCGDPGDSVLDRLVQRLADATPGGFSDDVSAACLEFRGGAGTVRDVQGSAARPRSPQG